MWDPFMYCLCYLTCLYKLCVEFNQWPSISNIICWGGEDGLATDMSLTAETHCSQNFTPEAFSGFKHEQSLPLLEWYSYGHRVGKTVRGNNRVKEISAFLFSIHASQVWDHMTNNHGHCAVTAVATAAWQGKHALIQCVQQEVLDRPLNRIAVISLHNTRL